MTLIYNSATWPKIDARVMSKHLVTTIGKTNNKLYCICFSKLQECCIADFPCEFFVLIDCNSEVFPGAEVCGSPCAESSSLSILLNGREYSPGNIASFVNFPKYYLLNLQIKNTIEVTINHLHKLKF